MHATANFGFEALYIRDKMKPGDSAAQGNILDIIHKKRKEPQRVIFPVRGITRKDHICKETGNFQVSVLDINVREEKSL